MDRLPLINGLAEKWAGAQIEHDSSKKDPALHAATGLCLAALQPGIAAAQRTQWMAHAAQLCPHLGWEVAQMAWAMPESSIRAAFRSAWPDIDPNLSHPQASGYAYSLPFGARSPPILMALAYGNVAAVSDAITWHGEPVPQMATSETEKYRATPDLLVKPASWLAWALSFRQWDLADHLFAYPLMREQESLDRALLEVAGTLATPVSPGADPLRHMDVPRACAWIKSLNDAGADLHRKHPARAHNNKYQMFLGTLRTLDRRAIEEDGWIVSENEQHKAYCYFATRKLAPGQEYLTDSPAQWLMSTHGPIGWPRKPRGQTSDYDLKIDRAIKETLAHDIPGLVDLWQGATSRQWHDVLSAVVASHSATIYEASSWANSPWCPDFLLDGFSMISAEEVFSPDKTPHNPHCLWLDAIALHVASKSMKTLEVSEFYDRAVGAMSACLHGNIDAFSRGLQRAMAFQGSTPNIRFSVPIVHGQIDDFLAIQGIQGLLASLPDPFRESFAVFANRDRELHAEWLAKADPGSVSLSQAQVAASHRAWEMLSLHRGTLSAMGTGPGTAPRPIPRM